ncbi:MAG: hypothetical protein NTW28_00615 [Candidatus Solibacter sp.]|nr:hypothetical protein [Candidatus Solibacter sp.]
MARRSKRASASPRLTADRRLEVAHHAALQLPRTRLAGDRGKLDKFAPKLSQLSPLRVLERGHAIVSNQAGVVTDDDDAPPESCIHLRLHQGALDAVVETSDSRNARRSLTSGRRASPRPPRIVGLAHSSRRP